MARSVSSGANMRGESLHSAVCPGCGRTITSPSLDPEQLLAAHRNAGCPAESGPSSRAGEGEPSPPSVVAEADDHLDQVLRESFRTVLRSREVIREVDEALARSREVLTPDGVEADTGETGSALHGAAPEPE